MKKIVFMIVSAFLIMSSTSAMARPKDDFHIEKKEVVRVRDDGHDRDRFSPPRAKVVFKNPSYYRTHPTWYPIFLTPLYIPRTETVVVERTVVQPVVVEQDSALQAYPASEEYVSESGQLCREYQAEATVGSVKQVVYGTACMQPDGTWRVVD